MSEEKQEISPSGQNIDNEGPGEEEDGQGGEGDQGEGGFSNS